MYTTLRNSMMKILIFASIIYLIIFCFIPLIPLVNYFKLTVQETGYSNSTASALTDPKSRSLLETKTTSTVQRNTKEPKYFIRNKVQSKIFVDSDKHYKLKEKLTYTIHKYEDTQYSGFDVIKANLTFLPNFKNPCWVEKYTGENVYNKNRYVTETRYPFRRGYGIRIQRLKVTGVKVSLDSGPCNWTDKCRLRCLPYFMLIGVAKSATTDFSLRVRVHPSVGSASVKELYWWTQFRFDLLGATLGDYADLFDRSITRKIMKEKYNKNGITYHNSILGEFTSMTFFDFAYWRRDPQNLNRREPENTVANDIHKILPNIKLIVILRNPVSRLYSSYNMFNKRHGNPEDFHKRVLGSIWWWNTCVEMKGLPERNCLYGSPPEMPPVYDKLGDRSQWWNVGRNYTGEIRHGMYGLIINDWINVFPRKNILFLRTEDYRKNATATFNEIVFPFLGLSPLTDRFKLNRMKYRNLKAGRIKYKSMLVKTRDILSKFYEPFNLKLTKTLGDEKGLWKDDVVKVQ